MKPILILVVLVLIAAGGYFLFMQDSKPEILAPREDTRHELPVTRKNIYEEADTYVLDVVYPQFGVSSIDTQIQQLVENSVAEFKTLPPNPPESVIAKHSMDALYDSVYVGPDVVSFRLVISQYTGGAHPLSLVSGLNFDRSTGRQLLQQDAFAMIGMTAEQVSIAATAELKAKLGDVLFEEGVNSNPENFSSFVISEDSVTFIFQEYQVAAYAAGVQQVSFPRK